MASIKVKFRPSAVADHEGSVYYQIIHERRVRQLLSKHRIFPDEWDESRSSVIYPSNSERREKLLIIRQQIRMDIERLTRIRRALDAKSPGYTADDIIDDYHRLSDELSLLNYMARIIVGLRQKHRARTAETYASTFNSFSKFLIWRITSGQTGAEPDIMLDCINSEIMESYESWLRKRGLTSNTVSFYTRILRAVYNRAVEEEIIENRFPFRRVYTGVDKTVKRALPLTTLRAIRSLDLSQEPKLDYARDMFLMSFYLRGMSFIDMSFLKKSDLKNGCVTYRRRKTGQQLAIGWTKEMQSILNKYPENPTPYLLPIIRKTVVNERSTYRNMGFNINRNLKKIAGMIGISIPLTLYVARHSWASAARTNGIPVSVISEGMGHDSEATTRIYLASLDTSVIDHANALIISSI